MRTTGDGHDGIGIYGMTEDNAGPPPVWKGNTIPATKVAVQNPPNSGDQTFPQAPIYNPASDPAVNATYSRFATIDATRSAANATAAAAAHSADTSSAFGAPRWSRTGMTTAQASAAPDRS